MQESRRLWRRKNVRKETNLTIIRFNLNLNLKLIKPSPDLLKPSLINVFVFFLCNLKFDGSNSNRNGNGNLSQTRTPWIHSRPISKAELHPQWRPQRNEGKNEASQIVVGNIVGGFILLHNRLAEIRFGTFPRRFLARHHFVYECLMQDFRMDSKVFQVLPVVFQIVECKHFEIRVLACRATKYAETLWIQTGPGCLQITECHFVQAIMGPWFGHFFAAEVTTHQTSLVDVFFEAFESSETGVLSFFEQCAVQSLTKVLRREFVLVVHIVIAKVVSTFWVLFFFSWSETWGVLCNLFSNVSST